MAFRVDYSLEGRHALVCGASSGIGRAVAIAMASQGAEITALARRQELLDQLVFELRAAGAPEARALRADLDDRPAALKSVDALLQAHGPVHILVNNTGGPPRGALLDADEAELRTGFGRHVLAAQQLTRATLPGMRRAGYGRIINVISISVREPIVGLGVSNTIRGAMSAWSKTLSRELPPGITINNILPGFTDTERLDALKQSIMAQTGKSAETVVGDWLAAVPEGRLARPEELGAVAAFLASPAASFIRGVNLPVDGGRLHSM